MEWHPGELYPRVGFIVTNLRRRAKRVVAFYNRRGTAEQWIKEGIRRLPPTHRSGLGPPVRGVPRAGSPRKGRKCLQADHVRGYDTPQPELHPVHLGNVG